MSDRESVPTLTLYTCDMCSSSCLFHHCTTGHVMPCPKLQICSQGSWMEDSDLDDWKPLIQEASRTPPELE